MKKTLTYYLVVLSSFLITTTTVNAQTVQNADCEKLDGIVANMLGQWDRPAYLNAMDLMSQVFQYDLKSVAVEALPKLVGIKTAIEGTPDYRLLFHGKLLTGHFVLQNLAWVKEADADDLQFSFTDKSGKPCVIKVATSEQVKKTTLDIDFNGSSDDNGGDAVVEARRAAVNTVMNVLEQFFDGVTELNFEVPALTSIEITSDGQQLMHTAIKVDLDALPEDLSEGMLMDVNTAFLKEDQTNFFELNLTNTGYKAGSGINLDFAVKNAGDSILSFKLNAPGTFKGFDTSSYISEDGIDIGFESLNIDVDMIGQVQFKGVIGNLNSFILGILAIGNAEGEEEFKDALAELNKQMSLKLFYDKNTTPAATIELASECNEEGDDWGVVPVINFASSNSTYPLDEFFTAENFPEVTGSVVTMASEIGELVQKAREKANENAQGIKSISRLSQVVKDWYKLDGRRTNGIAKGLKLMRMVDGTVRKTMSK